MKRFMLLAALAAAAAGIVTPATADASSTARPVAESVVQPLNRATTEVFAAARHHRHHRNTEPLRIRALEWARTQRGKPYIWGDAGPNGYDCSGIVMWAYHHAGGKGRRLLRDTYEMLSQVGGLLRRVRHPKAGDLAFFGPGHVELWLGREMNRHWGHGNWYVYGAEEPGTTLHADRIFPGTSWWPTAYYQVV